MVRVYPKATSAARVLYSDNYDPVLPFAVGCQMVALNWQTNDTSLLIYKTFFRQNGGCGFVLKPKSLLENRDKIFQDLKISIISCCKLRNIQFDLEKSKKLMTKTIKRKSVKSFTNNSSIRSVKSDQDRHKHTKNVLSSAPNLSTRREILDPLVVLDLYDYDPLNPGIDKNLRSASTKSIKTNGWNPNWLNSEKKFQTFVFKKVCRDTAFLVVKVKNENFGEGEDIGRCVIQLLHAKTGFRICNLENKKGERIGGAQVFLKIDWD